MRARGGGDLVGVQAMRRFFIQLDTGEEVDSDTGPLVRFEDCAALQKRIEGYQAIVRSTSSAEEQRLREQVHKLNNDLTAVLLERDALDRKCAALALLLYGNPLPHGNGV